MLYYAVIRQRGKIVQKDITSIKSVAFDILKKEIELSGIRKKHTKNLIKMALKELKDTDKTDLLGPVYQIVKKDI